MVGRPSFPFGDPAHFQGRTVLGSVGFCFCRCWWEILTSQEWTAWIFQVWSPVYQHDMAIAGKSAFLIGNTSSLMVDFPWVMLVYQKLALWKLQPFNCKTNTAREKMQIESTLNHLRPGRLRLWEKRYKQNVQNLDFFKMFINFNVHNCIRNTKVYIYIYTERQRDRERERESMGTCFVFYNLKCTLFAYLLIWGSCWIAYVYACGTV